jgi:hypothetical protein
VAVIMFVGGAVRCLVVCCFVAMFLVFITRVMSFITFRLVVNFSSCLLPVHIICCARMIFAMVLAILLFQFFV